MFSDERWGRGMQPNIVGRGVEEVVDVIFIFELLILQLFFIRIFFLSSLLSVGFYYWCVSFHVWCIFVISVLA